MRFTVTPLGSREGRPVAAVVADIAEYLLGREADRDTTDTPGQAAGGDDGGPARYYADGGDQPGRWFGQGAVELGLQGQVDGGAFRNVLGGRDPRTGQRLISARGSAGRVRDLGVGTAVRWDANGEPLYGAGDVAAVLGWSVGEVVEAIADGERAAAELVFAALAGAAGGANPGPGEDDPGLALVPVVNRDGSRVVPERELSRVEALVAASRSRNAVLAGGDPDDVVSVPAASRLVGASRSYLARLCRNYVDHRDEIQASVARGQRPKWAYVVCDRAGTGEWRITRGELSSFVERRRQPAVRVGYDITATTEKSFSVLALLGGPKVRRAVLAAIEAGNDQGMAWLERHAAAARAGGSRIGVTGWTVASFQHLTSRRLDPFVHHHNVVANTVVDETGIRRALDARPLYHRARAAAAIATAQARYELTTRLGVAFRPARRGGWEIAGIDDAVLDEFSQRTREIHETIRELEDALGRATTIDELHAVVASTRPAKPAPGHEATVIAAWWARAQAHGLAPTSLASCLRRARPTVLGRRQRAAILAALESALTAERSVFTRGEVLTTLVDLENPKGHSGPIIIPAVELERLADEFLASARVVPLAATSGRHDVLTRHDGTTVAVGTHEAEYSTMEILTLQADALDRYAQPPTGAGSVDPALMADTLARFPELSTDQRRLVATFCSSGRMAQSAIGRPGTGKTHAMRAAVHAWNAAGYRVMGTAVKAEAARHLGTECGIPAEPLAWYLNRLADPAHSPLDARSVLIVDEASTIGDRALHALLVAATRDRAALRFIGDPAQHGSITAGGLWRVITERFAHHTPELTLARRVRHHSDIRAAEALRAGRVDAALAELEDAGHLHILPSERDLYRAMLTRWWHARQAGHPHPMVDRRNDQRLVLNRLARRLRQHMGELGDTDIPAHQDRRFASGDEVIARMGDRHLHPPGHPHNYLRNGSLGTVIAICPASDPNHEEIIVRFTELGDIALPRPFFDLHTDAWGRTDVGLDHAYAVTSYAVEGLTFNQSSSHVDPASTRPEVYVDITRGRHSNHLFLTATEDPLPGERLPAEPPDTERHQLEHHLTQSQPEPVALDLDPLTAAAVSASYPKTLQELTRERMDTTLAPSTRALAQRAAQAHEHQIARWAIAHPDPSLTARLGPRPAQSYLAARYDQLLADVAIQRSRWAHGRSSSWNGSGSGSCSPGSNLGGAGRHPAAADDERALIARIRQLADAISANAPHDATRPARGQSSAATNADWGRGQSPGAVLEIGPS